MISPIVPVRRLTSADVALYREIRLEALRAHPDAFASTYEKEVAFAEDFLRERLDGSPVFAGFDGDSIVGMAGFYRLDGEKVRHKGVLWGMYVRPSARGKGYSASLAEAVIDHARGCVEILSLSVVTGNDAARRLYERMGFVAYGIERRALKVGETYLDEVLMAMPVA